MRTAVAVTGNTTSSHLVTQQVTHHAVHVVSAAGIGSALHDPDVHRTAVATIALAVFAFLSFIAAGFAAFYARRLVQSARQQLLQSEAAERLRFTDMQIRDMTTREMQEALDLVLAEGRGEERAKEVFETIKQRPPSQRSEDVRAYARAASLYDLLFDRISAYAESGAMDEQLFFSQHDQTIMGVYLILKEYWWESNRHYNFNPRIMKFVTRAFLYHMENTAVVLGDEDRLFFEAKAREFYPGDKTEALIDAYDALRHQNFLEA